MICHWELKNVFPSYCCIVFLKFPEKSKYYFKMNPIKLYLVTLFCLIRIGNIFSQEKSIKIPLLEAKSYRESKGNSVDNLGAKDVWMNEGKIDSISWTVDLDLPAKIRNENSIKQKLYIVTRNLYNDSISLEISRKNNIFIDKDIVYRFHADSLKKWNLKTVPDYIMRKVKFNFNFFNEINDDYYILPWEAYFIPFSIGMTYNDARLNEMPLSVRIGFNKVGHYGEDIVYVSKRMSFNKPEFRIYKEGNYPHEDKVANNIRYKEKYSVHDTIFIDNKFMRIDSVDTNFSMVYLTKINDTTSVQYISVDLQKELSKYFSKSSKYLIIDFWGTWCAPCVASMPKMKVIFEDVKEVSSFVGVCFDKADKFDLAKEILNNNKIHWPQIYIDMSQQEGSIISEMHVSTFPTYIIIDRKGRIVFRDSSEGLSRLREIVLN